MPAADAESTRNRIIAALPQNEYVAMAPHLERVELDLREILFDVDQPIEHVYFPETAVISVLGVMSDGSAVETATIGREGMVGLPVFLRTDQTSAQAFTQIAGTGLRMTSDAFREVVARLPALTGTLHRYTQALFTLVAQSSACNRLHRMEERCARWLLHTHDRVGADSYPLTHQFLSQMIGVRRATVTEAMGALQTAGAVTYEMGVVRVVDRAGLEGLACECYRIIVREFDRLLGGAGGGPRFASPLEGLVLTERGKSVAGDASPRTAVGDPASQ